MGMGVLPCGIFEKTNVRLHFFSPRVIENHCMAHGDCQHYCGEIQQMNPQLVDLLKQSGFKVFGDVVVAADYDSSGNASISTSALITRVVDCCVNAVSDDASKQQIRDYCQCLIGSTINNT